MSSEKSDASVLRLLRPRADVKAELWERIAKGWEALYSRDLIRSTGDEEPDYEKKLEIWGAETKQFLRSCFECNHAAEHPVYLFEKGFQSGLNSEWWTTAEMAFALLHKLAHQVDHLPEPLVSWEEQVRVHCARIGCEKDFPASCTAVDELADSSLQRRFVVHRCPACDYLNVAMIEQQKYETGVSHRRQVNLWPVPPAILTGELPDQLLSCNALAAKALKETLALFPFHPQQTIITARKFLEAWLRPEVLGSEEGRKADLDELIRESRDKAVFRLPDTRNLMHCIRIAANARIHSNPHTDDAAEATLVLNTIDLLLGIKYRAKQLNDQWNDLDKQRKGP
jgi:hypothetical protein